jgi:hypothetical protein
MKLFCEVEIDLAEIQRAVIDKKLRSIAFEIEGTTTTLRVPFTSPCLREIVNVLEKYKDDWMADER